MSLSRCPAVIMIDVFLVREPCCSPCLHSTSTFRLFRSFVLLWEVLCGFYLMYGTYCRGGIGYFVARLFFGYVAFFIFLYWAYGRQLNFLINTSTLGRCWSALLGLPPRFGHDSLGAPGLVQQSPGTLPNSRGPVKFPCGLGGRQRDHLYLYQNSQRSPLWSSHGLGLGNRLSPTSVGVESSSWGS